MAISLISPGIKITEQDLVASQQAVATTAGAFAGQFRWGPVEDPTLVESEADLVSKFGQPNTTTAVDFLSASNFLGYSQQMFVTRVVGSANTLNATAEETTGSGTAGTGLLIKNDDIYESTASFDVGPWIAKFPGAIGNSIKVSTCPSATAWSSNAGIVTVAAGSTTVVGDGTDFSNTIYVGDQLVIDGRVGIVASIANATYLTLETAHIPGAASVVATRRWQYFGEFDVAPGTTTYTSDRNGSNDEMHIVVVDEDGVITGVAGQVLEKFASVSKASDAKGENGGSNYYKDVVNNGSSYIRWTDHDNAGSNWGTAASGTTYTAVTVPLNYSLAGGNDGDNVADSDRIGGYLLYANKDTVPASLIVMGQASAAVVNRVIADVAEVRRDAIVCFSPTRANVVGVPGSEVNNITTFISGITRSTYAFMDSGWKYQYNKYTDSYIYIPLNADSAGCMARNDLNREPWISPAGFTNGQVQNIVRLAWNPTQSQRDSLYKLSVNPVFTQVGKGTVLFGDKTFTTKNTSTNRINVRRLFIELQRTISNSADNVLFDRNDDITRTNFVNLISPYLRSVQARRGISAFRVVCDTTNNPESVVNANEFVCDIFVQPIRSVNFIQLNFVSVAGSATFNEIVA
jgi:hypothetical protein